MGNILTSKIEVQKSMMERVTIETTCRSIWHLWEKFREKNGCMASSIPWRQSLGIGI